MIYVINSSHLTQYHKDNSIDLFLTGENAFELLTPSDELQDFWRHCKHTDEDWDTFKSIYLKELETREGQEALDLITFYSSVGKSVNLCCSCSDSERCIRSLVAQALIDRKNEVYVE